MFWASVQKCLFHWKVNLHPGLALKQDKCWLCTLICLCGYTKSWKLCRYAKSWLHFSMSLLKGQNKYFLNCFKCEASELLLFFLILFTIYLLAYHVSNCLLVLPIWTQGNRAAYPLLSASATHLYTGQQSHLPLTVHSNEAMEGIQWEKIKTVSRQPSAPSHVNLLTTFTSMLCQSEHIKKWLYKSQMKPMMRHRTKTERILLNHWESNQDKNRSFGKVRNKDMCLKTKTKMACVISN